MLHTFENTSISMQGELVYANRNQIEQLYEIPKRTLADSINRLKQDGLIVGAEIRPKSGRPYEIYDLDEIISIGFRLRSEKAVKFQRWAREEIRKKLIESEEKRKMQQAQLDWFWDKQDQRDLYP